MEPMAMKPHEVGSASLPARSYSSCHVFNDQDLTLTINDLAGGYTSWNSKRTRPRYPASTSKSSWIIQVKRRNSTLPRGWVEGGYDPQFPCSFHCDPQPPKHPLFSTSCRCVTLDQFISLNSNIFLVKCQYSIVLEFRIFGGGEYFSPIWASLFIMF